MDSAGRLVRVGPERAEVDATTTKAARRLEFDWAETWAEVPWSLKVALPVVLVLAGFMAWALPAYRPASFLKRGEAIVRGIAANDRERVIDLATSDTLDAAGEWFDLMRLHLEEAEIGQDVFVSVTVYSGNPEKDTAVTIVGMLLAENSRSEQPLPMFIHLRRVGQEWSLDGAESLAIAQRNAASGNTRQP